MHVLSYLLSVLENQFAPSWHVGHRCEIIPAALPIFFWICLHPSERTVTKPGHRRHPQRWSYPGWELRRVISCSSLFSPQDASFFLHNQDVADICNLLKSLYHSLAELLPSQLFLIWYLHSSEVLLGIRHSALFFSLSYYPGFVQHVRIILNPFEALQHPCCVF